MTHDTLGLKVYIVTGHHMFMVHGKHKKIFLPSHTHVIVGDPSHIRSPLIYIKDGHWSSHDWGSFSTKYFFFRNHRYILMRDHFISMYVKNFRLG